MLSHKLTNVSTDTVRHKIQDEQRDLHFCIYSPYQREYTVHSITQLWPSSHTVQRICLLASRAWIHCLPHVCYKLILTKACICEGRKKESGSRVQANVRGQRCLISLRKSLKAARGHGKERSTLVGLTFCFSVPHGCQGMSPLIKMSCLFQIIIGGGRFTE